MGVVPGIDEETFISYAEQAKKGCPVSQALAAVEMSLVARLSKPSPWMKFNSLFGEGCFV